MRTVVGGGGWTCLKQNLFHSRMIRTVVGGGGRTCLKQNLFHSRMIRTVVGGGGRTCLKQNRGRVKKNRLKGYPRKDTK